MNETPKVYSAINAVQKVMAKQGITKDRRNTQGSGYNFRGVDDVMNALAGHLADAKLMILPRAISRECVERQSKSGGALFYTTIHMEYDFVSAEDGSKHTVAMYGEAMDSGDKSANKAASAAFKYACFQAFCIPTEGDNDADGSTHEVAPKTSEKGLETPKNPAAGQAMIHVDPIKPETAKILSEMCSDGAIATIIDKSLTKLGVLTIGDMSEKEGQTLINFINSKKK